MVGLMKQELYICPYCLSIISGKKEFRDHIFSKHGIYPQDEELEEWNLYERAKKYCEAAKKLKKSGNLTLAISSYKKAIGEYERIKAHERNPIQKGLINEKIKHLNRIISKLEMERQEKYGGMSQIAPGSVAEDFQLYCPQCALEGNLTRLEGRYCPIHKTEVPNPVSRAQAEELMKAAEDYETQLRLGSMIDNTAYFPVTAGEVSKETEDFLKNKVGSIEQLKPSKKGRITGLITGLSGRIKSITWERLVESIVYFLSFLLIGALTTRVPNSPSIWIFVLYGLAALFIGLFMRIDD